MDGVVYIDKHMQPSHHKCLGDLLTKYYGTLDAENIIRNIAPIHQTGDMHISVYDYTNMQMYVSNAAPAPNGTKAYDRKFVRIDMKAAFAEQKNDVSIL